MSARLAHSSTAIEGNPLALPEVEAISRGEETGVPEKAARIRLTKRQEDVLRFLRDKGRAKSPDIEAAFRLTRARVGQIVKPLVDAGLVTRAGRTRATTYRLSWASI